MKTIGLIIGFGLLVAAIVATSHFLHDEESFVSPSSEISKENSETKLPVKISDVDSKVRRIVDEAYKLETEAQLANETAASLKSLQFALLDLERRRQEGLAFPEYLKLQTEIREAMLDLVLKEK